MFISYLNQTLLCYIFGVFFHTSNGEMLQIVLKCTPYARVIFMKDIVCALDILLPYRNSKSYIKQMFDN